MNFQGGTLRARDMWILWIIITAWLGDVIVNMVLDRWIVYTRDRCKNVSNSLPLIHRECHQTDLTLLIPSEFTVWCSHMFGEQTQTGMLTNIMPFAMEALLHSSLGKVVFPSFQNDLAHHSLHWVCKNLSESSQVLLFGHRCWFTKKVTLLRNLTCLCEFASKRLKLEQSKIISTKHVSWLIYKGM